MAPKVTFADHDAGLEALVEVTRLSATLMTVAVLQKEGIFSKSDKDALDTEVSVYETLSKFYTLLQTKGEQARNLVIKTFQTMDHSEAANILKSLPLPRPRAIDHLDVGSRPEDVLVVPGVDDAPMSPVANSPFIAFDNSKRKHQLVVQKSVQEEAEDHFRDRIKFYENFNGN